MTRNRHAYKTREAIAAARLRLARADDLADDERAAADGDRLARARLQLARGHFETLNQWSVRNGWGARDAWRAFHAGQLTPERRCPDGTLVVVEHDTGKES